MPQTYVQLEYRLRQLRWKARILLILRWLLSLQDVCLLSGEIELVGLKV
jgi:hypothetical protein